MGSPEAETPKPPITAKERAQRQLAPLTHQGWSFLLVGIWPQCKACILKTDCVAYDENSAVCGLFSEIQAQRIQNIMSLPHVLPEHMDLVSRYCRNLTFLDIVDSWLMKMGPFRRDEETDIVYQGILERRFTIDRRCDSQAAELALTPASRRALGFDKQFDALPITKQVAELRAAGGTGA